MTAKSCPAHIFYALVAGSAVAASAAASAIVYAQPVVTASGPAGAAPPSARPQQPHPSASAPRAAGRSHPTGSPRDRVGAANDAARIEPDRAGFVNAIQQYTYNAGALYQVYTKPGQVTDIALEPGEQLVGPGPVAAGDTARWLIGDTLSGSGASARVHILVKPVRPDIMTNLVINTDRRTYHIELRANPAVYMASVSWTYPEDALIALKRAEEATAAAAPAAAGIDLAALDFGYRIEGAKVSWRPLRAFDDGTRVYIEFPEGAARGELPPLFLVDEKGEAALVNYRVAGRYMIVDQLFAAAELRLGDRKRQTSVRILAARSLRR